LILRGLRTRHWSYWGFYWGWHSSDLESLGSQLGQTADGDDQGKFGFRVGADDATDVAEFVEKGFEELGQCHGVEVIAKIKHARVVFGEIAAAGVVVKAAEAIAANGGLGAGASGGEFAGAKRGMGRHRSAPFMCYVQKWKRPPLGGLFGSGGSISILTGSGKMYAK
jgi:hypothetical protein